MRVGRAPLAARACLTDGRLVVPPGLTRTHPDSGAAGVESLTTSRRRGRSFSAAAERLPFLRQQFAKGERDLAEGQNAAAGGTWLEGFLNDGIKQDAPKPAKRGLFGRGR